MIDWLPDLLITLVLLAAVGFGAISVIGLLLFPDIRSRSFTGIRAGILATALVTAAGTCYGLYAWYLSGGIQYLLYVTGAVLMLLLVTGLNHIAAGILCRPPLPVRSPEKKE